MTDLSADQVQVSRRAIKPQSLRIHSSHAHGSVTKGNTLGHPIDGQLRHLRNVSDQQATFPGMQQASRRKRKQTPSEADPPPSTQGRSAQKDRKSAASSNRRPISRRVPNDDFFDQKRIDQFDSKGALRLVTFNRCAVRVVLQSLNRLEGFQPLQQNDPRSVVMVSLMTRVFAPITFENCEILVVTNEVLGSYRVYFTGGESVPFSACCKSFIFGEFAREKGLQLICASKYCLARVLYTVSMDYQKFYDMCRNMQITLDEKENSASVQVPESSKFVSRLIQMGIHKRTNLSEFYQRLNDDMRQLDDPSMQNEKSPIPTLDTAMSRQVNPYYLPFGARKQRQRPTYITSDQQPSFEGSLPYTTPLNETTPVYPFAPEAEPPYRGDLSKESVGAYLRMHKQVADNIWRKGKVFRVGDAMPPGFETRERERDEPRGRRRDVKSLALGVERESPSPEAVSGRKDTERSAIAKKGRGSNPDNTENQLMMVGSAINSHAEDKPEQRLFDRESPRLNSGPVFGSEVLS